MAEQVGADYELMEPPVLRSGADLPALSKTIASTAQRAATPERTAGLTAEVVVITRNSHTELVHSLAAIREAADAADASLLFVDLGSTDGTQSFLSKHAPGARGVWLDAGDRFGDAIGAAAAASEADVLVALSPTLEPSAPDAITRLVEHLEQHPYAAVAAPAVRAHTGAVLRSARPEPAAGEFACVEWVNGDALAIRRSDLDLVAGSAQLSRSAAELDLCIRLRRRGRELHFLPAPEWLDAGGRTAAGKTPELRSSAAAARRLLMRHPNFAWRLARGGRPTKLQPSFCGRMLDVVLAGLLLVILAPVLLAITIAIRLDSGGPALFRQRRLGRDAVPFEMLKFRTMHHDADPALHRHHVRDMIANHLRRSGGGAVQVFKVHPDPRVTRVGRVLRRTSLDELPQLLNVLRGDMTFVGFRPPIPYEVSNYPAWYHRRFDGKPGITGLWQVSGRNQRSYEEMVAFDIEYLNRHSWLLDLAVLLRTVGTVIRGRGAY